MQARLLAFLLWAAVAAVAVYWALRLGARAPAVPPQAVAVSTTSGARGDLDRLLGQAPVAEEAPAAPEAGRFQLVGVVAPRGGSAAEGLALIAVDGKPARAYRVGAAVDPNWVLQSVRTRGATLGPQGGRGEVQLELPPPPTAQTGVLPPPGSGDATLGRIGGVPGAVPGAFNRGQPAPRPNAVPPGGPGMQDNEQEPLIQEAEPPQPPEAGQNQENS